MWNAFLIRYIASKDVYEYDYIKFKIIRLIRYKQTLECFKTRPKLLNRQGNLKHQTETILMVSTLIRSNDLGEPLWLV